MGGIKTERHPCKGCGKMISLTKYMCAPCKHKKNAPQYRTSAWYGFNMQKENKKCTQAFKELGIVSTFNADKVKGEICKKI